MTDSLTPEVKLLPCPFCGKPAKAMLGNVVACTDSLNCGANVDIGHCIDPALAAKFWNKRASPEPLTSNAAVLNGFADNLKYWIDSYERREGVTDDTHVITPPSWPTVGQLKEWIAALRGRAVETGEGNAR